MGVDILAWALMVVGCAVHRVEAICVKKYNEKHGKGGFIFTALLSFCAMIFFFITDKGGLGFTYELVLLGIIGGVCYALSSFLTFVAMGCGPFVLTSLFLSYTVLVSMGYGLFVLDEPATVFTYIGMALIALSLFFVRSDKKEEGVRITLKWVLCILASFIGSGVLGILMKYQQLKFDSSLDNEFMIVVLAFSAVSLFIIGVIRNGKELLYTLRYGSPYAAVAGISNGATNLLNLVVNSMIPLSLAAPIRSGLKIILSFLVSWIIFKEKLSRKQILGVVLGAAALVVLSL